MGGTLLGRARQPHFSLLKASFVIALRSKFPFYDFHFQILSLALNLIKIERLKTYPSHEAAGVEGLRKFAKRYDHRFLQQQLADEGARLFRKLGAYRCPFFEKPLLINWAGFQLHLSVPEKAQMKLLECRYGLPSVLRFADWPTFRLLLAAVLNEKHIVLVHPNREVLARFMCANKPVLPERDPALHLALPRHLLSGARPVRVPELARAADHWRRHRAAGLPGPLPHHGPPQPHPLHPLRGGRRQRGRHH